MKLGLTRTAIAVLLATASPFTVHAQSSETAPVPDAPKFDAQEQVNFVNRDQIEEFKALPAYSEPDWVTKQFVDTGKLPPVKDRLPKEPLVFKAGNMPDGIGTYGDVLRHVIGGRPEGWNYSAGQVQGWGGVDMGLSECLTRTGPLFEVNADDLEPLPNLAKSWDWADDGKSLTVHLIEGAKWSDGVPFGADDLMFYWEDNVLDPNVTPLNGASQETFGEGTTLAKVDDNTVKFSFTTPFPRQVIFALAYGTFCPGPAHMLKPQHPKYSENSYDQYRNAFPPTYMGMPTMGAWVPVDYRSDDIIVMRRNPYYWKVDEEGHQLPYLDELQYRLSTWADRDVQAVAGTGDFSNLEQPESYVEALKRSAQDTAPARLAFGPRSIGYTLFPNLSNTGWGEPDARGQAIRELNRNLDFRKAVTMGIDRQRLGESLVKGPFTAIYPGGIMDITGFYDKDSTIYYPYNLDGAKAELEKAGLKDTDGDGFVNLPDGGGNVEVTLLVNGDYSTDKSLSEGIIAMMEPLGIRVIPNILSGNDLDAMRLAGKWDWLLRRNDPELVTVVQNTNQLAPVGPATANSHRAGPDGKIDLLDFEKQMVADLNAFTGTDDVDKRMAAIKDFQKTYTENVYGIGLTAYPGALIINKRFSNIPPGTPINMYNWAEDSIIRERVFVKADQQKDYELFPDTLPGAPGGAGAVKE